ncbi:MAG: TetR/AcrR family transcriptional regulator [Polyangiales bacterium]
MNLDSPKRKGRKRAPLRTRLRAATAGAILDAAEAVFARDGVQLSRMGDIAREAGVAVGTIYNHFTDRDALVHALLDARRKALYARIDAALADPGQAFEARFAALLGALFAHFDAHSGLFIVHMEAEVMQRGRGRGGIHTLLQRIAALVQEGVAAGALREQDAELYPTLLLGMLRALFVQRIYGVGDPSPADGAERMARIFLSGAGRRRPGERRR